MRRITRGFTIIELLVVVSVIGILATIVLIGFNRYQADTRDSQRSAQATILAEALEKYYDKNGEYPSCAALTGSASSVTTTILPGVEQKTLVTPQDPNSETNSIKCQSLTAGGTDFFGYVGDGSSTCSTGGSCLQFTLQYLEESTGTIKTITSRRTTNILTSGDIADLSASTYSFSAINLSWSTVGGATAYNIRYSTNSAMTSPTTFAPSATTNSTQVTGLTLGTQYWLQVQPATSTSTGNWSNISTATTYTLGTPTGTAIDDPGTPASKLKYTWTTVANATSYTINYSTSSSFTSPTVVTNAAQPYYVTGLAAGTTLYFRVQAVASGYTSGWSATSQAITQVPPPTCTAANLASNTSINLYWNSVPNATNYNAQISTSSDFSSGGYVWNTTGTSINASGLNNGTTYYFRVNTYISGTPSTWAACPSATTGVDGPTSVGWSADGYGVRNTANVNWMPGAYPGGGTYWTNGMNIYGTCQPGATVVVRLYQYYAYSNNTNQNTSHLQDWTWNNQDLYVVGGRSTWMVWWQGWVACQVGGNRQGDTYLGNAGPY